jgi:acetyl-CoA carboxylase biotin carboxylase subunit
MVTGVDLVKWQIRIENGQELTVKQEDVRIETHAIECRINAEDPTHNFRPSCGTISLLHVPGGPWVRFDSALYQGYTIPPFYDSMIAKLIVSARTRAEAIRKMQAALCEMVVEGVDHNAAMHIDLLGEPAFVEGTYTTDYLSKRNQ